MEGGTAIDTSRVRSGLNRLADKRSGQGTKKSRSAKGDHVIYRIKVQSRQGTNESLNVLVDCGVKQQPEDYLAKIADQLHVQRHDLPDVLDNWTKQQFLDHCRTLDSSALKPPAMRRGAPGSAPAK